MYSTKTSERYEYKAQLRTAAQIKAYKETSSRQVAGNITQAELDGRKRAAETRNSRFSAGHFTPAELEPYERESSRKLVGNFTQAELDGHKRAAERNSGRKRSSHSHNIRSRIN